MVERVETEYLHAKERAILLLGLPYHTPYPTNRQIKHYIGLLTKKRMGAEAMAGRVWRMREVAEEIMTVLEDFDPYLIGSTLSGQIRESSDIDLHVYCDHYEEVRGRLLMMGYEGVEVEFVENQKGEFVHLRWMEPAGMTNDEGLMTNQIPMTNERMTETGGGAAAVGIPVEITVHSWGQRGEVFYSSVTGKVMRRAELGEVRRILAAE